MVDGARVSANQRPEYRYLLKRLREAREESGLSQAEVAKALGRLQSWVSKSEVGERRVDATELQDFALLYEKPVTWFLPEKHA